MITKQTYQKEGFWRSRTETDLPMPKAGNEWSGQKDFLKKLIILEDGIKETDLSEQITHFRGWSTCRICECYNGCAEYHYDGWIWPEGYRHYIEEHNVQPSQEFYNFIMRQQTSKKEEK